MAEVLIVEDSKSMAVAQAYKVWESGHAITFAFNGQEALEHCRIRQFEVILLDYDLPDMTGLEVYRLLRKMNIEVPVVMVTGKGDERLAAQIIKEGAKDYLTKSSGLLDILPEIIDRVLQENTAQLLLAAKDHEIKRAHHELEQKVAELADVNQRLVCEIQERTIAEESLKRTNVELKKTLSKLQVSQAQVIQSDKMASVGQLAAGVAHEINNPIGFVSSNLFSLAKYHEDLDMLLKTYRALHESLQSKKVSPILPESVHHQCAEISRLEQEIEPVVMMEDIEAAIRESREGIDRVKIIVNALKVFAHPGHNRREKVDINANIEAAINLVWHEIKHKTEVCRQWGDLPMVWCYPQMLNQVFLNLLVNAAQSIDQKGAITIHTWRENNTVLIRIEDTGCGISPEHLHRIFDPFFTTKEVGKGTGLGLKIVYDIVQTHGGRIDVDSKIGHGTAFTISLPLAALE